MGEYQRAVEALLQAMPLIDRQAEPRQWNILRLNLANVFCHLGRHREAMDLIEEVKPLIAEQGDEIDLIRVPWLEGRIAAGLGWREEALRLFAESRRAFAAREMSYDVALALLEEAVVLLEEGRLAEAKELAPELKKVFEAKGVHREALAALRLFHEAAEREAATIALARRVLHYLYRARHDQELPFSGS
jgi:tetratricopeptide (TPR) repeat protein